MPPRFVQKAIQLCLGLHLEQIVLHIPQPILFNNIVCRGIEQPCNQTTQVRKSVVHRNAYTVRCETCHLASHKCPFIQIGSIEECVAWSWWHQEEFGGVLCISSWKGWRANQKLGVGMAYMTSEVSPRISWGCYCCSQQVLKMRQRSLRPPGFGGRSIEDISVVKIGALMN